MRVSAVAAKKEKTQKTRSLRIYVCKQHKENNTKVKAKCDKIIHRQHLQSTGNICLVKEKFENAVGREQNI